MKNQVKLLFVFLLLSGIFSSAYGQDSRVKNYASQMARKLMKSTSPNTGYNPHYYIYDVDYSFFSQSYTIKMSAIWKGKLCLLCEGEETFEIKGRLTVKKDGSSYNFYETDRNSAVRGALTPSKIEMYGVLIDSFAETNTSTSSYTNTSTYNYSSSSNKRRIYVKNDCNETIKIAIRYRYNDDDWATKYWFEVEPNKGSYLYFSNGNKLSSNNGIVYVYAQSYSYSWSGDESRKVGSQYYDMRKYDMNIDADGDYVVNLNCNN
ncbi:DUF1036 domain-containing protein [Flagellimonas myxillae]|uniref:DUF1036 domain-containing protein n=1 Tax=Flagellimonas myxillae TaxID=2942214 RepID=UPI00201EA5A7|nr:DUF1036 domain-containing protein [Muricauda myxillae]MCL6265058.1 DUF1036 domain-containing protein [Muricauda myxillae]